MMMEQCNSAGTFSRDRRPHEVMAIFTILIALTASVIFSGCHSAPEVQAPAITPFKVETADVTAGIKPAPAEPDPDGAQLLSVGFGADGILVSVGYTAPPKLAQSWRQGNVYIVDERTGIVYDDVPVVPVLGPLFSKPHTDGQAAYVMLSNPTSAIKSGAVVTVVLGNYKRLHVTVQ
jgi:hypothetical protein